MRDHCDFTPFVAGSRMTRTNQEPPRRDGRDRDSGPGDREEKEARPGRGPVCPGSGWRCDPGRDSRGPRLLEPHVLRKVGTETDKLQHEHYIWCDPQTNKQARPPSRQLARPPYDGLFAIRLITFHIKAILYSGSVKECCAGTAGGEQLHLSGTSNVRLELSATQPAWRGEGSSAIKRAVRERGEGTRLVITSESSLQTRPRRRTDREMKDKRAQLNIRQTKL